jgi:hypothetical protein
MKMFNDSKIYIWFSAVTFAIAMIVGAVSFYSILKVEPQIVRLLDEGSNVAFEKSMSEAEMNEARAKMNKPLTEAYILLRDPQIFARYENFDFFSERIRVKFLPAFDKMIKNKEILTKEYRPYLDILLERRMAGSRLGRMTMTFFFILSLVGLSFYFWERRTMKKTG